MQQSQGTPEPILAGAAISRGRVFFVSSDAVYAIGPKTREGADRQRRRRAGEKGEGEPAYLQVAPTELVLKPGQTVKLHARLFDAKGRFLREEPAATWSLQGLKGHGDRRHVHGRRRAPMSRPGSIKATVGAI